MCQIAKINYHEIARSIMAGCQTNISSLYGWWRATRNVAAETAKPHFFLSSGSQVTCQIRRPVTLTTLSAKSRGDVFILTPWFPVGHWPINTSCSASPMNEWTTTWTSLFPCSYKYWLKAKKSAEVKRSSTSKTALSPRCKTPIRCKYESGTIMWAMLYQMKHTFWVTSHKVQMYNSFQSCSFSNSSKIFMKYTWANTLVVSHSCHSKIKLHRQIIGWCAELTVGIMYSHSRRRELELGWDYSHVWLRKCWHQHHFSQMPIRLIVGPIYQPTSKLKKVFLIAWGY